MSEIIQAVFILAIGQVLIKLFIEPIQEHLKTVAEIYHCVTYYRPVGTGGVVRYYAQSLDGLDKEQESPSINLSKERYLDFIKREWAMSDDARLKFSELRSYFLRGIYSIPFYRVFSRCFPKRFPTQKNVDVVIRNLHILSGQTHDREPGVGYDVVDKANQEIANVFGFIII